MVIFNAWLAGNLILLAASVAIGFWGSGFPAEGGYGYGLIAIGGLCAWAAWVVIGSVTLLLMYAAPGFGI